MTEFPNFKITICFWRENNSEDEGGDDMWHSYFHLLDQVDEVTFYTGTTEKGNYKEIWHV